MLENLVVKNDKLVPANKKLEKIIEFTSSGKSEIDPGHYDCFLIYGLGLKAPLLKNDSFYTEAVVKQAAKDHVVNTLSFSLFERLRSITDKKVFIGHSPMPALKEDTQRKEALNYKKGLAAVNKVIYTPARAMLVNQPVITIVRDGYTDSRYTKGSKRLAVGSFDDDELHPGSDNGHMNSDFGKEWLSNLTAKLNKVQW
jgi:hypothetical protein